MFRPRQPSLLFLFLGLLAVLSSCTGLFEGNLWGALERPRLPSDRNVVRQKLSTETNILRFYRDDPQARAELLAGFQPPLDPTNVEDARLYVQILVGGTYSLDIAQKILTQLLPSLGYADGGFAGNPDLQQGLAGLFGGLSGAQIADTLTALNDLTVTQSLATLAGAGELAGFADVALLSASVSILVEAAPEVSPSFVGTLIEQILAVDSPEDQAAVDTFIETEFELTTLQKLSDLTQVLTGGTPTEGYEYLSSVASVFGAGSP